MLAIARIVTDSSRREREREREREGEGGIFFSDTRLVVVLPSPFIPLYHDGGIVERSCHPFRDGSRSEARRHGVAVIRRAATRSRRRAETRVFA